MLSGSFIIIFISFYFWGWWWWWWCFCWNLTKQKNTSGEKLYLVDNNTTLPVSPLSALSPLVYIRKKKKSKRQSHPQRGE
jgi:hypothetical protein